MQHWHYRYQNRFIGGLGQIACLTTSAAFSALSKLRKALGG
jgi:hypothetical protein